MDKIDKRFSLIINITFTLSYIYFILFYSNGVFDRFTIKIPSEALTRIEHFLFESESGMIPLAMFILCLIIVSVLSFVLHGMKFSKSTAIINGLCVIPPIAPILCNSFFGPISDNERSNTIWLIIMVFLLIYLIVFQIFFCRDYKKI